MKIRYLFLICTFLATSCASSKKFVYLNDMQVGMNYPFDYRHEAVIQCNDRLDITVSCKQPELAIPFNIQTGSASITSDGKSTYTSDGESGYQVDSDGYIDFPVLGKIYMDGLKVSEAIDVIRKKIIEGEYIKEPLVSINFLNFKYTVLGAVGHNGSFTVDDGRITLLEAIANAGDLTSKARLDKVAVIREIDGKKRIFIHDIRSTDIFESPCFYLQQNDLIYVQPRYFKKDAEDRTIQIATLFLTGVTAVCSAIWAYSAVK